MDTDYLTEDEKMQLLAAMREYQNGQGLDKGEVAFSALQGIGKGMGNLLKALIALRYKGPMPFAPAAGLGNKAQVSPLTPSKMYPRGAMFRALLSRILGR